MANDNVEIIRIEFDADKAIKNTQELLNQRDALVKKGKELVEAEGKNSKAALENEASVRILNDQIREQKKVTDNIIKSQKEAQGSNQALKAELSKLTSEYNRLSKEERTTSDAGLQLKGRIIDITNELKNNESAIGNNFRNVGNYRDALSSVGGPIGNVTKGISGFNTALKGNPILAVVILVQSFTSVLQKLQPVADLIEQAFSGINRVFDVLLTRLQLLTEGDFIGAFSGLGGAIADAAKQGANYAKNIQNIDDAQRLQNISNSEASKQIAILNAQLKDRTKTDQERLKIADDITKIETENFNSQKKIFDDRLKSEKQAIKDILIAKKVRGAANIEDTKQLLEIADAAGVSEEKFKKLEEAQIAVNNSEQESGALLERTEARRNAILDQRQAKIDAANEKTKAQRAKDEAEDKARTDAILKLQAEFFLSDREKLAKSFDDKKKVLDANNAEELKLINQIEKTKVDALAKFDQEAKDNAAKAEKEKNDKILDEKIKAINEQAALNDQLLQNELAAVDNSVASEQDKARRKAEINLKYLQLQLKNAEDLADADKNRTDIEKANIEKVSLAITKAQNEIKALQEDNPPKTIGELLGATGENAEELTENIQFATDAFENFIGIVNQRYNQQKQEIEDTKNAEIQAIQDSTLSEEEKTRRIEELNKDAARKKYEIELKQFNADKALRIVNATMDIAAGIIKAFGNPIKIALVAALGAAQLGIIAAQKPPAPPKFADGVVGLKGPGNGTSDSVPAMLSNGESVITASGTKYAEMNYPGLLQFLNSKNKFADGVVNFNGSVQRNEPVDIGQQIRLALQDLTIVTRVSDIEKASFDRQSVRTVGVI